MEEMIVSNKDTDHEDIQKVAIVIGSSSGIGYATSLLLARNGFYTYASVRNIDKSANLQSIADAEKLFEINSARRHRRWGQ